MSATSDKDKKWSHESLFSKLPLFLSDPRHIFIQFPLSYAAEISFFQALFSTTHLHYAFVYIYTFFPNARSFSLVGILCKNFLKTFRMVFDRFTRIFTRRHSPEARPKKNLSHERSKPRKEVLFDEHPHEIIRGAPHLSSLPPSTRFNTTERASAKRFTICEDVGLIAEMMSEN